MRILPKIITCVVVLSFVLTYEARSQFFDQKQTEFITQQAKTLINDYAQYANFMGDLSENNMDREEYKKSFIALFDNITVQVYNDLDPEHKTSEFLEIPTYAEYLMLWYSDAGLKTEINPDSIRFGTINKQNSLRYYVTTVVEKNK